MSIKTNKFGVVERAYKSIFKDYPELCYGGDPTRDREKYYMFLRTNARYPHEDDEPLRWHDKSHWHMMLYLNNECARRCKGEGDRYNELHDILAKRLLIKIDAELMARWERGDRGYDESVRGRVPMPSPTPEQIAQRKYIIRSPFRMEYSFMERLEQLIEMNEKNDQHVLGCDCDCDSDECEPECDYDWGYEPRTALIKLGNDIQIQNYDYGTFTREESEELYGLVMIGLSSL